MRLRLLKVIVQPIFIVDDKDLTEMVAEPVVVTAADWPTYATDGFAEGFEALRQQVEGSAPGSPNRAARRHPPKQASA